MSTSANFGGHPDRECGEHRTTGERAWCYQCSSWCYPTWPCAGCALPQLRAALTGPRGIVATATGRLAVTYFAFVSAAYAVGRLVQSLATHAWGDFNSWEDAVTTGLVLAGSLGYQGHVTRLAAVRRATGNDSVKTLRRDALAQVAKVWRWRRVNRLGVILNAPELEPGEGWAYTWHGTRVGSGTYSQLGQFMEELRRRTPRTWRYPFREAP